MPDCCATKSTRSRSATNSCALPVMQRRRRQVDPTAGILVFRRVWGTRFPFPEGQSPGPVIFGDCRVGRASNAGTHAALECHGHCQVLPALRGEQPAQQGLEWINPARATVLNRNWSDYSFKRSQIGLYPFHPRPQRGLPRSSHDGCGPQTELLARLQTTYGECRLQFWMRPGERPSARR